MHHFLIWKLVLGVFVSVFFSRNKIILGEIVTEVLQVKFIEKKIVFTWSHPDKNSVVIFVVYEFWLKIHFSCVSNQVKWNVILNVIMLKNIFLSLLSEFFIEIPFYWQSFMIFSTFLKDFNLCNWIHLDYRHLLQLQLPCWNLRQLLHLLHHYRLLLELMRTPGDCFKIMKDFI